MNLAHLLIRSAQRFPQRPLWVLPDRTITYAEAEKRMRAVAGGLLSIGSAGDRVAILSKNRFEAYEAYLATLHAGMIAVPMNPKLHANEYAYMLENSGARTLVFSEDFDDMIGELGARGALPPNLYRIGEGTRNPASSYESLMDSAHLVHKPGP